jgi:hypothetical protein
MQGKLVGVRFWDHSMGSGDSLGPILCELLGLLYKEDKHCYYVCSWICGKDPKDPNSEGFSVLKSTVEALVVLHYTPVKSFEEAQSAEIGLTDLAKFDSNLINARAIFDRQSKEQKDSKAKSRPRSSAARNGALQARRAIKGAKKYSKSK